MPNLFSIRYCTKKYQSAPMCPKHTCQSRCRSRALDSGILKHFHWFPIEQRIKFKLATLTHNTVRSIQPAYLHSLLNHTPTRSLRSANRLRIHCPFLVFTLPLPPVVSMFASNCSPLCVELPLIWPGASPEICFGGRQNGFGDGSPRVGSRPLQGYSPGRSLGKTYMC